MSDKQTSISADDLDFIRAARMQVSQVMQNLEAAQAIQAFIERTVGVKYQLGAEDAVNLDTGEINRVQQKEGE